ncbi:MAG: DUF3489 domain-containing protein [Burkholderiaceae bacterium]|nr:MAG: DUF3489 domain-containing protein [Burkholderiaceae bacterium]
MATKPTLSTTKTPPKAKTGAQGSAATQASAANATRPTKATPSLPAKPAAKKKTAQTKPITTPAKALVSPVPTSAPTPSLSKQAQLIALLRSPRGGTLEQMTQLTGWQAHTVRGAISGVLRKRLGLDVQCAVGADLGKRVYRITEPVAV